MHSGVFCFFYEALGLWFLAKCLSILLDVPLTRTSGALPKTVVAQGNRLVVKNVDASVNTTFICQATNRVGQVSSEQVVFVRGETGQYVAVSNLWRSLMLRLEEFNAG